MLQNLYAKLSSKVELVNCISKHPDAHSCIHVKPVTLEQCAECPLLLWIIFVCSLLNTCSKEVNAPTFTAWGGDLGVKSFRRTSRPTRVRYV